jgi:ATP-binding cassette subfamily B protein
MVIDSGKIVESGSHESLIEQKGFYYNLYTSQFNNVET